MKILHVISSTDARGGGPIEVVNATSEVWRRHGHVSHVASLDAPDAPWLIEPSHVIPLGVSAAAAKLPGGGYSYSPRLSSWLRDHAPDYDAVIVHGLWNYGSLGSWRGLHRSRTPYFLFTHGMLDPYFVEAFPAKARLKSIFWTLFEHKVLRDARRVLFTTDEERDLAPRSFKPYRAVPLVVGLGARDVSQGGSVDQTELLAKAPGLRGRRFVLFLSRIHPKKGIDLLIRAFAAHHEAVPDLDLLIAGPDQVGLKSELQALAAELGVAGRIHWPGMLTGAAKAAAFQQAWFFALPSHQENFGIAIAEALAYGVPVLITPKINIFPQIERSAAGVVVADDVGGVSEGFRHMATLPEVARNGLAANARRCFVEHFELERVALAMLDAIAEACRDHPAGSAETTVSRR